MPKNQTVEKSSKSTDHHIFPHQNGLLRGFGSRCFEVSRLALLRLSPILSHFHCFLSLILVPGIVRNVFILGHPPPPLSHSPSREYSWMNAELWVDYRTRFRWTISRAFGVYRTMVPPSKLRFLLWDGSDIISLGATLSRCSALSALFCS